jgi:hypothetical protein
MLLLLIFLIDTYTGGASVGETVDDDAVVVGGVGVGAINVVTLAIAGVEPLAVENKALPASTKTTLRSLYPL